MDRKDLEMTVRQTRLACLRLAMNNIVDVLKGTGYVFVNSSRVKIYTKLQFGHHPDYYKSEWADMSATSEDQKSAIRAIESEIRWYESLGIGNFPCPLMFQHESWYASADPNDENPKPF